MCIVRFKIIVRFSTLLVAFTVGCNGEKTESNIGNGDQEVRSEYNSQEKTEDAASELEETLEINEESVDLDALIQPLLDSLNVDEAKFLLALESIVANHPNQAGLVFDTFIENVKPDTKYKPSIAIAIIHKLSEIDPEVAFDYATTTSFGPGDQTFPVAALLAEGNVDTLIPKVPMIRNELLRTTTLWSIGRLMDPDQLASSLEWIGEFSPEDRKNLMSSYDPKYFPSFEEFDEWPYKELLGDAIRPVLARSLALQLESIENAEDAQAKLKQFEELPGYTESDRDILEHYWYDRYLQNDSDKLLWALEVMNDRHGNIAVRVIAEPYKQSPEAAFDFVRHIPDKNKHRALGVIMFQWYYHDSKSASEYIATLPPGEIRYLAARELAQQLKNDGHQDDAMRWESWAENKAKGE